MCDSNINCIPCQPNLTRNHVIGTFVHVQKAVVSQLMVVNCEILRPILRLSLSAGQHTHDMMGITIHEE